MPDLLERLPRYSFIRRFWKFVKEVLGLVLLVLEILKHLLDLFK